MGIINALIPELGNLESLSAKYADYQKRNNSEIVYEVPVDDMIAQKAKSIKNKSVVFSIFLALFLALFAVLSLIAKNKSILLFLFMAVASVFCIYNAISTMKSEVKVMMGTAVYKQRKRGTGRNRSKMYYVSVIPDSGEKVIYTRLQISKKDFYNVNEGTPVMVVKTGLGQQACLY